MRLIEDKFSPKIGRWAAIGLRSEPPMQLLRRPRLLLFRDHYEIAKRVLDLSLCVVLLPAVLLVLGLCTVLIWLNDSGPVFFSQIRTGKGGKRFKMFKVRTMVRDAERMKEKYRDLNELSWPDFKIENDPRVTFVGRFLRRTSLDELPQIFNVILGDMTFVGPRPTSFDVSTYRLLHTERLEVKPGITGLWQVSGRSDIDFEERVRLDVEYIENRSLWFDLQILGRTVIAIIGGRGSR